MTMTPRIVFCAALALACTDDEPEVGRTAAAIDVTWTNVVGADAIGNDLAKTGATSLWDAGAVSVETIPANGYVEFTTAEANTTKSAGLSTGDTDQGHADIDFAIRLRANGSVGVYEGGVLRGSFGGYAAGDLFRIEVEEGVVSYQKNGATIYISAVAPTFPLLVDTSLLTPGATINGVELVSTTLSWQNLVGVEVDGNDLTKTAVTGTWTAGASTVEALGADGFVEFAAGEATTAKAAGLSNGDTNQSYTDIDFAIRLQANGAVTVYEDGILRGSFGSYIAGDRFRVDVSGGVVTYSMNGARPFYTSAVTPVFPLLVDTAFLTPGGTINDVTLTDAAGACPTYDGGGLVCDGSFTVANAFDLAEIADCASITGNLTINAPGMTVIDFPVLERVGGDVLVNDNTDLARLRMPALVLVGGTLNATFSSATRSFDLSRLGIAERISNWAPSMEASYPCLGEVATHLDVRDSDGGAPAHVPRLRSVGGNLWADMTAPALDTVGGNVSGGLIAPVLVSVGAGVFARPLDAPVLTEIAGTLSHGIGQNLPALARAGGLTLNEAPSVDLPSLTEITGTLAGGTVDSSGSCTGTAPAATVVDLPALERVGAIRLCWHTLQDLLVPQLMVITGPSVGGEALYIQSSGASEIDFPALVEVAGAVEMRVNSAFPLLERITGRLDVLFPIDTPALLEVGGGLLVRASMNAPSLALVGGDLRIRSGFLAPDLAEIGGLLRIHSTGFAISVSLPSLTTVDGINASRATRLSSLNVAALTTVVGATSSPDFTGSGDVVLTQTRLASISMPLLTAIPGDLRISQNDFLTSMSFPSLAALGPRLFITNNQSLPACYAIDLRDQLVDAGWTGSASVNGNNGTGSCP
jgi:hypothetical protein